MASLSEHSFIDGDFLGGFARSAAEGLRAICALLAVASKPVAADHLSALR
jgi:hypothetical protein